MDRGETLNVKYLPDLYNLGNSLILASFEADLVKDTASIHETSGCYI